MDELNDLRQRVAELEEELEIERIMREQEGEAYRNQIASLMRERADEDAVKRCEVKVLEAAVASRDEIIKAMAEALYLTSKEVGGEWDESVPFCNKCSLCDAIVEKYAVKNRHGRLNFCPDCGAKMKGGAE